MNRKQFFGSMLALDAMRFIFHSIFRSHISYLGFDILLSIVVISVMAGLYYVRGVNMGLSLSKNLFYCGLILLTAFLPDGRLLIFMAFSRPFMAAVFMVLFLVPIFLFRDHWIQPAGFATTRLTDEAGKILYRIWQLYVVLVVLIMLGLIYLLAHPPQFGAG